MLQRLGRKSSDFSTTALIAAAQDAQRVAIFSGSPGLCTNSLPGSYASISYSRARIQGRHILVESLRSHPAHFRGLQSDLRLRAIAADLIGDSDMPLPATKSQKKKWTKETRAHLSDWVITEIMPRPSRIRLIYSGGISDGAVRHDSSISRMVALSMVPARCSPWAALWIASKASLLNLALLFIA